MIDFEEELKKFQPSLQVEDAEEAINGYQNTMDMVEMMLKLGDRTKTKEEQE